MNEQRIKELADQAWVYQMTVYEYDGVRTYGEREQVFSKEKFAELIVRECMDLALSEQKRYASFTHRNLSECAITMSNFRLLMKDHFGVEK